MATRTSSRASRRTALRSHPRLFGLAGRQARRVAPLDAGLGCSHAVGAPPPCRACGASPRCAGEPGSAGSLHGPAAQAHCGRPFGLRLDAAPESRVPPRPRARGRRGSAPAAGTGAWGRLRPLGRSAPVCGPPARVRPGWGRARTRGLCGACRLPRRVAAAPGHRGRAGCSCLLIAATCYKCLVRRGMAGCSCYM